MTGKKKSTAVKTEEIPPEVPAKNVKVKVSSKSAGKTADRVVPGTPSKDEEAPQNTDYSYFQNVNLSIDKKKYYERPIATKQELDDIKKKMDDDVNSVKDLMAKLEKYLRGKVEQIGINSKQFEITIPIEYMSLKFTTILSVHPQWIFIKCKLMDLEDVPEKMRHELFEHVLVANFELNAVFYSVDPQKSGIWVENDITVPGLDMTAFDIKFNAIIFGIRYFVDSIALPLNQEMKSTFENSGLYT